MSWSAATALSEARFWGRPLTRLLSRYPGQVVVALAVCGFAGLGSLGVVLVVAALALGLRVWACVHPISFAHALSSPVLGRWHGRRVRRLWPASFVQREDLKGGLHQGRPREAMMAGSTFSLRMMKISVF